MALSYAYEHDDLERDQRRCVQYAQTSCSRTKPLRNVRCVYCGKEFSDAGKQKEHVVGRDFVPRGTLENAANVICFACEQCNGFKSDFEDDIAVITMLPDIGKQ